MTALVAETLLESLDLEPDVEVSAGWREEIRRRCAAIDQAVVALAQGEQLIVDLRAKYDCKYQFDFVPLPVGMLTPAPSRSSEFFRQHQDSPLSHRPRKRFGQKCCPERFFCGLREVRELGTRAVDDFRCSWSNSAAGGPPERNAD